MRQVRMWGLALGVVLVGALPLVASQAATITGEVVDQQCFLDKKEGGRGAAHQKCANGCVTKGKAVAIVTDAGEVYTITGSYTDNKNAKLVDFVAKTVEAKGEVSEKDGQKTIAVASLAEAK